MTAGAKVVVAPPGGTGGSGITQLTGDVTAGPGTGTEAATLVATTNVENIISANSTVASKVPLNATNIFYAQEYASAGAIGAGNAAHDTAAMTAAAAAMVAAGAGIMVWPSGIFLINSWPSFGANGTDLPYAIQGQGSSLTIFKSYATSLATTLTVTAPTTGVLSTPMWGGFTIDGTNATGTAKGIAWSDVSRPFFEDIQIQNFTGASQAGWYFYNQVGWCEEATFVHCMTSNCTSLMEFAIGPSGYPSFDYWTVVSMYFYLGPNQSGIVDDVSLGSGAQVQHLGGHWRVTCNAGNGATNTGSFFLFKGFSAWNPASFILDAEIDGGGAVNHQLWNIANASTSISGWWNINILGAWRANTLNYATQLAYLAGPINLQGSGAIAISPSGINRAVTSAPSNPTLASGSQSQNTSGYDQMWIIPITSTGAMTAKLTLQYYSISSAPTTLVAAASTTGQTHPLTVLVPNGTYIRIDLVNGSFGTITAVAA
jgi:hypothetical protein